MLNPDAQRSSLSVRPGARTLRLVAISLLLLIAGLALYLRLNFFLISVSRLPTNTDEALNMLMAKDIAGGAHPLLFWTQPYQFPLEAYLLAPFYQLLPKDALGARLILALLAGLSALGFAAVYGIRPRLKDAWPGLLLIMVPSAYFLLRQSAYLIPQYTSTITFGWLLPVLLVASRSSKRPELWGIPLGLAAGLALSVHLLSLAIVAGVLAVFCWGSSFRSALRNTLFLVPSFLAGLAPYLFAMTLPNAYEKVTSTVPPGVIWERFWSEILFRILPVTLGINPCIFPDMDYQSGPFPSLVRPFVVFFMGALVAATLLRIWRAAKILWAKEWPALEIHDALIGATWIALLLAAMAGFGVKYRYLLPVAFYFPFILSYLYAAHRAKLWRVFFGTAAVLIAALNLHNSRDLMAKWNTPHFADHIPGLFKTDGLVRYFDRHRITHCYAAWWLAYRISYETDGRIVCSQPFNERFPGWPLPWLRSAVDHDPNTPYVLTARDGGPLNPLVFRADLSAHQLAADHSKISQYHVFRNFRHNAVAPSRALDPALIRPSASENTAAALNLLDANLESAWQSSSSDPRPWIRFDLERTAAVHMIRMYVHARRFPLDSRKVRISVFNGKEWSEPRPASNGLPHRFRLSTSEKYLGHSYQELTFGFPRQSVQAIRIQATGHRPEIIWKIGEVEIFGD